MNLTSPTAASPDTAPAGSGLRFRIEGSGPLGTRATDPAGPGAAVASRAPAVQHALRSVLALVQHAAGGAEASSRLRFEGISFAASGAALADNVASARGVEPTGAPDTRDAVVVNRWLNLGPDLSTALLSAYDPTVAQPPEATLAWAVRVLRHEAQHIVQPVDALRHVDMETADFVRMSEAVAERVARNLPELRSARDVLGMAGQVGDRALAATLELRPYLREELDLDRHLATAGAVEGDPEVERALRGPLDRVARWFGAAPAPAEAVER